MSTIFFLLLSSLGLGIVHGITPDEHTWPITFSYAIGSYSSSKGLYVGFLFSLAFAIQRSIAGVIVYLALINVKIFSTYNGYVYLIVGIAMLIAGLYVTNKHRILHLEIFPSSWLGKKDTHDMQEDVREIKPSMALIHGFIAGWGFGAFALILYTIIIPKMPNVYFAILPGLFFGLGTMIVQVIFGGLFGHWIRSMKLTEKDGIKVASKIAGTTLTFGGIIFILGGLLTVLFPKIANISINTGIDIGNLHHLGLGFAMVTTTVLIIGMGSIFYFVREMKKEYENRL